MLLWLSSFLRARSQNFAPTGISLLCFSSSRLGRLLLRLCSVATAATAAAAAQRPPDSRPARTKRDGISKSERERKNPAAECHFTFVGLRRGGERAPPPPSLLLPGIILPFSPSLVVVVVVVVAVVVVRASLSRRVFRSPGVLVRRVFYPWALSSPRILVLYFSTRTPGPPLLL